MITLLSLLVSYSVNTLGFSGVAGGFIAGYSLSSKCQSLFDKGRKQRFHLEQSW